MNRFLSMIAHHLPRGNHNLKLSSNKQKPFGHLFLGHPEILVVHSTMLSIELLAINSDL